MSRRLALFGPVGTPFSRNSATGPGFSVPGFSPGDCDVDTTFSGRKKSDRNIAVMRLGAGRIRRHGDFTRGPAATVPIQSPYR